MNRNDTIENWEISNLLEGLGVTSTYSNEVAYNIPTINLTLTSIEVKAEPRKMRAQWTPDLAQEQIFEESQIELKDNRRVKRQRYKDRKMYIKMIEIWCG